MRKSKIIEAYFGFLVDDYNMYFVVREMPNMQGIYNPTYLYSFYNQYGCITIKEIAQCSEWDCYIAERFYEEPQKCIQQKVNQRDYLKQKRNIYFTRTYLKYLAEFIQNSISETGNIWGIVVEKKRKN